MDNSTSGKIEDATPVLNTHQPEAQSTTFEQVKDKMESSVDSKNESSVDSKNESSVDNKNESSVDSKNESSVDNKNESYVDNKNESSVDSKNESSVDSKNESSVDNKNELFVDSKNESSVDSKNESSVDSNNESSVDSKINGQSADNKDSASTHSVDANPDLQNNKLHGETDSVTSSEPTKPGVEPPQSNIVEGGAVPTGESDEMGEAKTIESTVSVSNTPAGDHKDSNDKTTSDTSVVISDKPVNAAETPMNTAETPMNTAETPMNTAETPMNTAETPMNTAETPMNTAETPMNTAETPMNTAETPMNTAETPMNTAETRSEPVTSPDTAVSMSETPVNSSIVTPITTESTPTATLVASVNSSVSTTDTPVTTVSTTSSAPTTEVNSSVTLPDNKVDCKAEDVVEPMETKDSAEEITGAATETQKDSAEEITGAATETQKAVEGSKVKKRGRGRPPKSATASTPVEREASRRSVQSYVKPTMEDKKADNMGDDNTEESNDDTPVLGSLEGPVPIQTGKRNRRKVDRLAENITVALSSTSEKKKLTIPEGTGVKLRDVQAIEEVINKTKAEELKIFHRLLYGSVGKTSSEVKKNIRNFCGWSFSREDAEYKRKQLSVARINLVVLKTWCTMLQLSPAGTSLYSKEVKQDAGKRKRASKATKNLQGEDEGDADRSVDEAPDQSDDSLEEFLAVLYLFIETCCKETKRGRKPAVNPSTTPSSGKSKNSADNTKKPGRRGRKSQHKSKEFIPDEDIAGPPTDAVLTKKIKELLKTADLEKVTMKIVRQQLIDMYPEYDLSDKRDFIKTTVKEILGA
ncbi:DEK [Bugula neritina]|uniref:DEK n=1 Tax=Bugula neritina TaxID=10212 RepID=A0A7J7JH45_BUGNE|nr:DEK [Bugula neritina]